MLISRGSHPSVFRLGRVSLDDLEAIAHRSVEARPTYDEVGATLTGKMPPSFRHDREVIELPARPDAFERGVDGLRCWAAHRGAGLRVGPDTSPVEGGTIAIAAPVGPVTAVAVCRVIAVVDEPNRYGFAYGTLPGHPERGEEAFVVERVDARTTFTITAFSRPAELLARLGGPMTRRIQRSTTRRYLDALAGFVASASTADS